MDSNACTDFELLTQVRDAIGTIESNRNDQSSLNLTTKRSNDFPSFIAQLQHENIKLLDD